MVHFCNLILGPQDNGFIQERGVVAGTRDGVIIVILIFLAALVAVFLVVLVLFRALSWLQFCAWTRVGFLRGRSVFFFCCCFGWRLSLPSWLLFWSLLLCSWGPGARISSCMVVSVPLSCEFCSSFLHLKQDDCQTILTFQHVISSLRVYASAVLNKVRSRYVKDPDCLAA